MNSEFDSFEKWLDDTLTTMEPSSRSKLLKKLGAQMRKSNQKRQMRQVGLDGTKWAGRKGKSKRKMMQKLRLSRMLKVTADTNQVRVGWRGKAGGIARVHHYGLRDRVSTKGVRVKYEARELLGRGRDDTDGLSETIETWLSA